MVAGVGTWQPAPADLRCGVGGGFIPSPVVGEGEGEGVISIKDSLHDPRLPPLSTAPPGLGTKKTGCPQRVLKLLLVQSTLAECRDAYFAQTWMESLPREAFSRQHSARPGGSSTISKILERYGPILEPRTLLCPRCLGVAYGNHPETVRQGWRRRQGKSNAEPKRRGRKSKIR